ncbi:MAG: hypothetical protein IPI73_25135, partial [Betaproteobacteria bacterium]|nr:hypothetical protein [Betaproteobacteria bacterium]
MPVLVTSTAVFSNVLIVPPVAVMVPGVPATVYVDSNPFCPLSGVMSRSAKVTVPRLLDSDTPVLPDPVTVTLAKVVPCPSAAPAMRMPTLPGLVIVVWPVTTVRPPPMPTPAIVMPCAVLSLIASVPKVRVPPVLDSKRMPSAPGPPPLPAAPIVPTTVLPKLTLASELKMNIPWMPELLIVVLPKATVPWTVSSFRPCWPAALLVEAIELNAEVASNVPLVRSSSLPAPVNATSGVVV